MNIFKDNPDARKTRMVLFTMWLYFSIPFIIIGLVGGLPVTSILYVVSVALFAVLLFALLRSYLP